MTPAPPTDTDDDDHAAWHHQRELEQQEEDESANMKIHEMMPSKFLKKEDVGNGVLVTVNAIERINVAMEGDPPELKYTMSFRELEKPLVLNSTNIQLCAQVFKSDDTDNWIGRQLVLYTDPNVSFGGKIMGGIRVRAPRVAPASTIPAPAPPPSAPVHPAFDDDIGF
jgi:hypothetical protein